MIQQAPFYALVVCDSRGRRVTVVGTYKKPKTLHGSVAPAFHAFCYSIFVLCPTALTIDTVQWDVGVDVEQAPVILVAKRTGRPGELSYSFPASEVQA